MLLTSAALITGSSAAVPMKVKHYRIGGAMPLFIMGIFPSIIGIIIGNGGLLAFGILFTVAAGGDIIALFMLRKLDKETYISDHPTKMGFYREIDADIKPKLNNE